MDDVREIERFLHIIKTAAENGEYISSRFVYSNLIRMGRRVVDTSRIANNFDDWINHFKNIPNIKVFVQDNWRYFCQFTNDDYNQISPHNMIKMYIPVDDKHINEAAKRIFTFMSENNMIHHSKIGSEVRFDDIVIRIDSKENAKKIEDFVMRDQYIMEGMMKPNPFAFNNGYISYAWDGELSFNDTVSKYISNYINDLKKNNHLNEASYRGFVAYVGSVYKEVFKENKNQNKYINDMQVEYLDEIDNYKKVTELLLESMMPDKKQKDFFETYDRIVFGKEALSGKLQSDFEKIYHMLVTKYGSYEADVRIIRFLETGNYNYFTREHGIRNYMTDNNITMDMVRELYITLPEKIHESKVLESAMKDTIEKYDDSQAITAIRMAGFGDYGYFTNRHGGRQNMQKEIQKEKIYGLIMHYYLTKWYDIKDIPTEYNEMYKEYIALLNGKERSKNHR